MGEPLSVAGSAVGIISLGIQVCNGLLVYADAIRGREQDMVDRTDEVRSLLSLFNSLEQTIGRIAIESPDNARLLLEYLRQTQGKLRVLEELLQEVNIPTRAPASLKGKMREAYQIAVYPMKKRKLENARQTLQGLVHILKTAQQRVNLDLEVSQANTLRQIQSTTSSNATELKASMEANSRHLQSLQLASEQGFTDQNSNITSMQQQLSFSAEASSSCLRNLTLASERGFAHLNRGVASTQQELQVFSKSATSQLDSIGKKTSEGVENLHHILSKLTEISLQLERSAAGASQKIAGAHDPVQISKGHQIVAKLASQVPPTSLKQACDLYTAEPDLVLQSITAIKQPPQPDNEGKHMSCKCLLLPRQRRESLLCCLSAKYSKKKSETKAGAQLRLLLSGFFATIIDVSLGLATQAGRFSLTSSLRCRSVIFDGPVENLIRLFNTGLDHSGFGSIPLRITSPFDVAAEYDSGNPERQYWLLFLDVVWTYVRKLKYNAQDLGLVLDTARWLAEAGGSDLGAECDDDLSDMILLQWIKDIVKPEEESLGHIWISTLAPYSEAVSFSSLLSLLPWLEVSPIAKAIMARSIEELDRQIELTPESVMELTYGNTTLEMACTWSPGLKRLLQTEAQFLLHDAYDISSLFFQCGALTPSPDCLDALLSAGMSLFPGNDYGHLDMVLRMTTIECVQIIAKHLVERLQRLIELAIHAGVTERDNENTAEIPNFATAARWCAAIDGKGVSIHPSIRVPMSYNMVDIVYHYDLMPLRFFPTFYEHGFTSIHTRNRLGLSPIHILRASLFDFETSWSDPDLPEQAFEIFNMLPWLTQHGTLAHKPHDPLNMGLNVHATGAHYIASQIGHSFSLNTHKQEDKEDLISSLTTNLLLGFAQESCRDKCVCWCNPNNEGCSPLKLLYKTHAHGGQRCGIEMRLRGEWQMDTIRNLLFDFNMFDAKTGHNAQHEQEGEAREVNLTARALELLHLLTFEALEMPHTCCMLKRVQYKDLGLKPHAHIIHVIVNCSSATAQHIREDPDEQKSAVLLDTLMEKFSDCIKRDYRERSFLEFILGPWKEWAEELYAPQEEEIRNMERRLNNVQAGIWPLPLQNMLWPKDPWVSKSEIQKTESEIDKEGKKLEEDDKEDEKWLI
ncbi:pyruvate decarboxylase [Fusarium albosuccineum]|uniref:Pyruvate decarboxylase n=1 Tax=Fusarium albosuccineum TaxID=1237068 RepID=A0A8H4LHF5_9HYPO|nr:pyruvate decarboxylase [Fusarium albosuccineum]